VGRLIARDDPDVADVVPVVASLWIRAIDGGGEQPILVDGADELHVVIVVRDAVLLDAPRRFHATDLEIVLGVRLSIRTVVVRDGVELLPLLREDDATGAREPGERRALDPADLIVNDRRIAQRRAGRIEVALADRRLFIDVEAKGDRVRRRT